MAQTRSQNKTAAKQNDIHRNKKPGVFADEPPSAKKIFLGALSQGLWADWLVCIAYCIFWHLIGSAKLAWLAHLMSLAAYASETKKRAARAKVWLC